MTTRHQIALVSIIALMAGLGFAQQLLREKEVDQLSVARWKISSLQGEIAIQKATVAEMRANSHEEVIKKEQEIKAISSAYPGIGIEVFSASPKISYFPIASSTYIVAHWNAEEQSGQSAVSVFRTQKDKDENDSVLEQVFFNIAGSCGQPFRYGTKDQLFFIHKNTNPCEGEGQDWFWWYDASGKEIVRSTSFASTAGSSFSYQLPGKKEQVIELITSRVCEAIPIPDDLYAPPEPKLPKVTVSGVKVGEHTIRIQPPRMMECWLMELNGPNYLEPFWSKELIGTKLILELPTNQIIELDVRNPLKYVMKEKEIKQTKD